MISNTAMPPKEEKRIFTDFASGHGAERIERHKLAVKSLDRHEDHVRENTGTASRMWKQGQQRTPAKKADKERSKEHTKQFNTSAD
jgi:hypothetical protein